MGRQPDPPIHKAAAKGNLGRVRELLDADPGLLNLKQCDGFTPLDRAASCAKLNVARYLLARGADPNSRSRCLNTALHHAACSGHTRMAELLLDSGADQTLPDNAGMIPLHEAAQHARAAIVGLLIARRADVNAKDLRGETPLHRAAYWYHHRMHKVYKLKDTRATCEALLAAGADINAQDNEGNTPLHLAAENEGDPHGVLTRFLLSLGADHAVRNNEGKIPPTWPHPPRGRGSSGTRNEPRPVV